MRHLFLATLFAGTLGLCVSDIQAQVVAGQMGFHATDGSRSAGTICSGFSCKSSNMVSKPNVKVTFTIRAPKNSRYFLIVGPSASMCQGIPGFLNQWAVPAIVVLPGTVTQVDTGAKCFGYMATFSATVPGNVRKGARATFQALAEVPDANNVLRPAFSTPVDIIIL